MRLHLVRHCAPLVEPGVCYGRSDLPVDPDVQANALPTLRAALPAGVAIHASPLQRCALLARALGRSDAILDARLAELDFGSWELRRWDDIARSEIDAWAADTVHYRPGGGENLLAMAIRIDAFYASLMASGAAEAVVICHAGSIRLLAARARGLTPQAMARAAAERPHTIGYGEIVIVDAV